ncbi:MULTISPECIES: hypothetical protein [unclassified Francisella]|uniref:hypothetical protein n=1 Tax=unclassified Francisella TaxID=2610885 RepID=UPI002E3543A1|nr:MULTISPECIES: hypothetical protein [unclassified Francisella]MED7819124.1 hypothetical protein [Francisella sp. 19S2-4]MED7829916.1 hypothetical protein [Francisella sp. 19S2-10]
MKSKIFLINIFSLIFNCSFASDIYENNDNGVPSFSNTPTKNSKKIDLGNINVINEPSSPDKVTIQNNINISNQSNNNSQLEDNYYPSYCSEYYNNYYSSYSYVPYMCEYFFHRHDYQLDNVAKRKSYSMNKETNYYVHQNMNSNRSIQMSDPMGMGMRMAGGRR